MKIITCTGFGNSGSSAATDFFSEFNNVTVVPHNFEFTLIHENDGLYDLENAIREGHRLKVDLAVKRFILLTNNLDKEYKKYFGEKFLFYTQEFINNVIGCKWDGWWHRINETKPLTFKQRVVARKLNYCFEKKCSYFLFENDGWKPKYLPPTSEYYDCDIDNFLIHAKRYILNLLTYLNVDKKDFLLIDQLLPPTNTELYVHYFDDIKVIIVDRDPRDYYFANNVFWISRYIPSFDVNTYINWYEKTRELVFESSNIKKIYLEDLVYNYNFVSDELISFCELGYESWAFKGSVFEPDKSKINTGLFLKYKGFEKEIEQISFRLSNFLYDYTFVNQDKYIKKDVIPALLLLEKYDEEYNKQKLSLLGILLSIKIFLKDLIKNK